MEARPYLDALKPGKGLEYRKCVISKMFGHKMMQLTECPLRRSRQSLRPPLRPAASSRVRRPRLLEAACGGARRGRRVFTGCRLCGRVYVGDRTRTGLALLRHVRLRGQWTLPEQRGAWQAGQRGSHRAMARAIG